MRFIPLKKEPSNYCKCSTFASALLHLFFNSSSVSLVEGERKNISCPRAQGILATPLLKGAVHERLRTKSRKNGLLPALSATCLHYFNPSPLSVWTHHSFFPKKCRRPHLKTPPNYLNPSPLSVRTHHKFQKIWSFFAKKCRCPHLKTPSALVHTGQTPFSPDWGHL